MIPDRAEGPTREEVMNLRVIDILETMEDGPSPLAILEGAGEFMLFCTTDPGLMEALTISVKRYIKRGLRPKP